MLRLVTNRETTDVGEAPSISRKNIMLEVAPSHIPYKSSLTQFVGLSFSFINKSNHLLFLVSNFQARIETNTTKMNPSLKLLTLFLGTSLAIVPTPPPVLSALPQSTIEPALTAIIAAQATQQAISPVSDVGGEVFGRFVQIWLENMVRYEQYSHASTCTLHIAFAIYTNRLGSGLQGSYR